MDRQIVKTLKQLAQEEAKRMVDQKLVVRQLLERKSTYNPIIDIGLFWVPSQNEFVTWQINKQYENESPDFGCSNGHYFVDYDAAKKDLDRRM